MDTRNHQGKFGTDYIRVRTAVHTRADERAFARLLGRDLDERTGIAPADVVGGAEGSAFELGVRSSRFAPRNDESVSFPPGTGHRIRAVIAAPAT
ncbi:hypothetical protein [Nocardia sp. NPDC058497]|uniref:hypothetical protein n=1 Tax=Nocardia sp. NPDC058497 TaxID=3346529 RepID=UPI00364C75F1